MVTTPEDILNCLGWKYESQVNNENFNNIKACLMDEPLSVDELSIKLKMPITELGVELSKLQLAGEVFEENGKLYAK